MPQLTNNSARHLAHLSYNASAAIVYAQLASLVATQGSGCFPPTVGHNDLNQTIINQIQGACPLSGGILVTYTMLAEDQWQVYCTEMPAPEVITPYQVLAHFNGEI